MLADQINKRGDKKRSRTFEISIAKRLHANQPAAKRISSRAAAKIAAVAGSGTLAISAVIFYRLRELLAALLFFSVAIAAVTIAVLTLWLAGEAIYSAASRTERHLSHIFARHFFPSFRAHAAHILRSPPWM